jgi:hypothetical protein
VDLEKVRQEVQAQGIPGLKLVGATVASADLVHLEGLTALQRLYLGKVTDAGLARLKGLTALQWLQLGNARVTCAGVEQLKKSLRSVEMRR